MDAPMLWAYTIAAAVGGACMLWGELQRQRQQEPAKQEGTSKRRKQSAGSKAVPAAADIPPHELAALNAFLRKVYKWRGWQGGLYHVQQAWAEVEAAAATAAGGSWQPTFDGLQLSCENCDKLLGVIDHVFFAGKVLTRLRTADPQQQQQQQQRRRAQQPQQPQQQEQWQQKQPVHNSVPNPMLGNHTLGGTETGVASITKASSSKVQCKIVQAYGPNGTWLCYFDPNDNVIYINRWRWGKHITPEHPVNCEGVVCTSRLHLLMHTLAHELVHAVVFHLFPEIDQSSPAYLPDDRHGPIFQLLNKQLFGHSSNALEKCSCCLADTVS